MPAQVGDDDTMARLDQAGDHVDVAMDVVGEPVKEKRDLAVAWTSFVVGDLERISVHGSQGFEPWQSSAHHGTWVLASHSSFPASFHGQPSNARSRIEAMSSSNVVIIFSSCPAKTGRSGDRTGRSTWPTVDQAIWQFQRVMPVSIAAGGAGHQPVKVASGCPTSTM